MSRSVDAEVSTLSSLVILIYTAQPQVRRTVDFPYADQFIPFGPAKSPAELQGPLLPFLRCLIGELGSRPGFIGAVIALIRPSSEGGPQPPGYRRTLARGLQVSFSGAAVFVPEYRARMLCSAATTRFSLALGRHGRD